jgi:nicotinate-nucleotide adenylyltransferase
METNRKKIGIMGGTFDPIHIGHLILGEKAYEELGLDKVQFMISGNPPHKRHRSGRATDEQREQMVALAVAGNPHFEMSLVEMDRDGYTYTYKTLEYLSEKNPDTDYYFIIGADSLFTFDSWREPGRICRACTLVAAVRDHSTNAQMEEKIQELREAYGARILRLHTENIDISSNMLREWVSMGKSLRYYVPDPVIAYIEEQQIYRHLEKEGGSDGTL